MRGSVSTVKIFLDLEKHCAMKLSPILKLAPLHEDVLGELRCRSTYSKHRRQMETCGQLHSPLALPPIPIVDESGCAPEAVWDPVEKRKIPSPWRESKHAGSVRTKIKFVAQISQSISNTKFNWIPFSSFGGEIFRRTYTAPRHAIRHARCEMAV
jgi:hypothetical protein